MLKQLVSLMLVLALLLTQMAAFAEPEAEEADGGFFGSVGGFLNNAWDSASDSVGEVLNETGKVIEEAWADTSKAAEETWASTSKALEEGWTSASKSIGEAWDWTADFVTAQSKAAGDTLTASFDDLKSWVSVTGDGALDLLNEVFNMLAHEMGIAGDKASELWNAIMQYAEANKIHVLTLVKLTLAIMVRLALNGTLAGNMAGEYISDVVITWFADNGIDNEEDAEAALAELEGSLNTSPSKEA